MTTDAAGNTSPDMPPPTAAPTPEAATQAIVQQETAALLYRAIGVRAWIAPLIGVIALTVALIDPEPWRRVTLALVALVVVPASYVSAARLRRTRRPPVLLGLNLVAMATAQLVVITATGGLLSPALPIMVPLAAIAAAMLGRRAEVAAALLTQLAGLGLLTLVQSNPGSVDLRLHLLRDGPVPGVWSLVTTAGFMAWALVVSAVLGSELRRQQEGMVRRAVDAQGEQIAMWRGWSHELQAVGAELAHEIKNPLASIKGLSALLARDVEGPKAVERLGVLRGEVDRMAALVDDLLTFSRPLSPLAARPVCLGTLCRRVAAAHEGAAAARGVRLRVQGDAPEALVDERKLTQVLVNLVQNALDAAPPDSTIELRAAASPGAVTIDVDDEGPGLHPSLGDDWARPGATTRTNGTGLGLTIALGLVRQHGGDLTLTARDPVGLRARIRLPVEAAA